MCKVGKCLDTVGERLEVIEFIHCKTSIQFKHTVYLRSNLILFCLALEREREWELINTLSRVQTGFRNRYFEYLFSRPHYIFSEEEPTPFSRVWCCPLSLSLACSLLLGNMRPMLTARISPPWSNFSTTTGSARCSVYVANWLYNLSIIWIGITKCTITYKSIERWHQFGL